MLPINRKLLSIAAALFSLRGPLPPLGATSPHEEQTASDLIKLLTHEAERTDKRRLPPDVFSCGQYRQEREWANSLANLGTSAIPEIEQALDSIEKLNGQSVFAFHGGWLAYAFAKIRGPAAYPRLLRMLQNRHLYFLNDELDGAAALSMGLTSFVAGSDVSMGIRQCGRLEEPRDALDHVILAWERNDRRLLEANLGPRAKGALGVLLKERNWGEMRSELWRGRSGSRVAVGYQFRISGRWSEPAENLDDGRLYGDELQSQAPEIETVFKDIAGGECGTYRVSFLNTRPQEPVNPHYVVDSPDPKGLLRLIASCAARTK